MRTPLGYVTLRVPSGHVLMQCESLTANRDDEKQNQKSPLCSDFHEVVNSCCGAEVSRILIYREANHSQIWRPGYQRVAIDSSYHWLPAAPDTSTTSLSKQLGCPCEIPRCQP
jgi:hypothetical protein